MSAVAAARNPGADAYAAALADPISFLEESLRSTPPVRSLHDWGAMPAAELSAQRIHAAEHTEHAAFLDVLRSLPCTAAPRILSDFGHLLSPGPTPAPSVPAEEIA